MANEKESVVAFGQTLTQKILYLLVPILLSVLIIFVSPLLKGVWGSVAVIAMGIPLGLVTFFVSAGWGYKLDMTPSEIKISDKRVNIVIPMDKVGMIVKNGGFPFPTLWVVLRGGGIGNEIPAKGVDPQTRELLNAYQKRNPGKTITYVPVPGGHIRSVAGFIGELKRRIPPLTVDQRLAAK